MNSRAAEAFRAFYPGSDGSAFTVRGMSMFHPFTEGVTMGLKPAAFPLKSGRCYAFCQDNRMFLHRCVSARGDTAVFIGDRCNGFQAVETAMVVGEPGIEEPWLKRAFIHAVNAAYALLAGSFPGIAAAARSRILNLIFGQRPDRQSAGPT